MWLIISFQKKEAKERDLALTKKLEHLFKDDPPCKKPRTSVGTKDEEEEEDEDEEEEEEIDLPLQSVMMQNLNLYPCLFIAVCLVISV